MLGILFTELRKVLSIQCSHMVKTEINILYPQCKFPSIFSYTSYCVFEHEANSGNKDLYQPEIYSDTIVPT